MSLETDEPFATVYRDAGTAWIGVQGRYLMLTGNPTTQDIDRLHDVARTLNSAAPEYAVKHATKVLRNSIKGGAS